MRRAKGYQDLDDSAVAPRPQAPPMPPPQEIEMASVSVVPDGETSPHIILFHLFRAKIFMIVMNLVGWLDG